MELHEFLRPGFPLAAERDELRLGGSCARAVERVPIVLKLVSQLLVLSRQHSLLVLLQRRRLHYRGVVWLQRQSVACGGRLLSGLPRLESRGECVDLRSMSALDCGRLSEIRSRTRTRYLDSCVLSFFA